MRTGFKTGLSFGLTSGVITTLGLMIGLHSGTHSKTVVLGGILTIAVRYRSSRRSIGWNSAAQAMPKTRLELRSTAY